MLCSLPSKLVSKHLCFVFVLFFYITSGQTITQMRTLSSKISTIVFLPHRYHHRSTCFEGIMAFHSWQSSECSYYLGPWLKATDSPRLHNPQLSQRQCMGIAGFNTNQLETFKAKIHLFNRVFLNYLPQKEFGCHFSLESAWEDKDTLVKTNDGIWKSVLFLSY